MWSIIKAEYSYTLFHNKLKTITMILFVVVFLIIYFQRIGLLVHYTLFGAIIITLHDDKRFYIYGTLPIKKIEIALARIVMLSINFTSVAIIILPISYYTNIINLTSLLAEIGILILVRLFSFILSDAISNYSSNKKIMQLIIISLLITIISVLYIKITTLYLQTPNELKNTLITLSYPLALVLAVISVKTFLAKDKIFFKEKA